MRNKRIILILLIMLLASLVPLYLLGLITDAFPSVNVKIWEEVLFWITPIIIFIAFGTSFIIPESKKRILLIIAASVLILQIFACGRLYYNGYSYYGSSYAITDNIEGISLDYFERILESDDGYIVYVGRKDCEDCIEFERKVDTILASEGVTIYGYYTSRDRDGKRSEEMYKVLESVKINSVPTLLYDSGNEDIRHVDVTDMEEVKTVIKDYNS